MGLLIMGGGILGGLGIFMAFLYSFAQICLVGGAPRYAHTLCVIAILAIMMALSWHGVLLARLVAVALLAGAVWACVLERGWFRVFPLLQQIFALVLIAGFVAV